MTTMDQIKNIRNLYYHQGKKISEISSETGLNRKTVSKYIDMEDFNPPEVKPASLHRFCPKLEPFKAIIDQWLEDDKKAPRKQRHTAKRVHKRLAKEVTGYDCSYRLVANYVTYKKKELNLKPSFGKLPIQHHPGTAQADFGAADFYENDKHHSGKYFVLSFPHSNQGYLQLKYGENMECLLEGLDAIFCHIGGVPPEIWFDNASTMVTKIIKGGGRETTEQFQRFCIHYGFRPVFMNPDSGHEKGNVEAKVGYSRRNALVPVPRFSDVEGFNQQLLTDSDEDAKREHYRIEGDICELFETDKKNLLPLPNVPFNLTGIKPVTTNGWGKFTLNQGRHEYSVSPRHSNAVVHLRLTSKMVVVLDEDLNEIVSHRRLYGEDKQESMDWIPYLDYISRHPRSLRNTGIFGMMPDVMQTYLSGSSVTEKGKILKTLSELTTRTGFDSAIQTVSQAVMYQATDVDSLKNLYRSLYSDVPELPPLQTQDGIPQLEPVQVDLSLYDRYLEGKEGVLQ